MIVGKVYTVSEVNDVVKGLIHSRPELGSLQIQGEISNFRRYPSGHCYFNLKDSQSLLKCVMFAGSARRLKALPRNGDMVLGIGRIDVYERDGVYQFYVDMLMPVGAGDLMLAFEALKKRLAAEGLFDPSLKKPIPAHPRTVGVITSSAGAAVRDIITVAGRRDPSVRILLYPVKVQGTEAPPEIVHALQFMNRQKLCDVLIVGRGGGSMEDLWAFNDERVVRAVVASKIPVISAVGHEIDFTLCDFAADLRAATPSAAAELAVPDTAKERAAYEGLDRRLCGRWRSGPVSGIPKDFLKIRACASISWPTASMWLKRSSSAAARNGTRSLRQNCRPWIPGPSWDGAIPSPSTGRAAW